MVVSRLWTVTRVTATVTTSALAVTPAEVAVIRASPSPTAVTRPCGLTVAASTTSKPLASVASAVNVAVSPTAKRESMCGGDGDTT